MTKSVSIQDQFLNQARKEHVLLTIFLMNGVKLQGTVKSFDSFVVLLEVNGGTQMVYKHAVSTIIPARNLVLSQEEPSAE